MPVRGVRLFKRKSSRRRILQALRGTHIAAAQMQGHLKLAEGVLTRGFWRRVKWAVWEAAKWERAAKRRQATEVNHD